MLTLYYAPGTIALASHIVLEEVGADYRSERLDFAAKEQRGAAYLAINPKGRVPTLATPAGLLTETPAILTWLAETHPEAGLLPADAFARARVNSLMGYLASTMHVAHAHMRRGPRWSDDPAAWETMKAKVPQNMRDCCRVIEDCHLDGPFVLGEAFSIADAYLFVLETWLPGDGVDPAEYPKVVRHMEAMRVRPAVARALAIHDA